MSAKYKTIVFDWDGTLYDSVSSIVSGMEYASKKTGLSKNKDQVQEKKQFRNIIGLRFDIGIKKIYPKISLPVYKKFISFYKQHSIMNNAPILFKSATGVLRELKNSNFTLAIATGKSRIELENNISKLKIRDLFSASRCADESYSKPHPKMLLELLEELNTNANETLMVGDSIYDVEFASNAGVDALAVTYGAHSKNHLSHLNSKIKGYIENIQDLPVWLKTKELQES